MRHSPFAAHAGAPSLIMPAHAHLLARTEYTPRSSLIFSSLYSNFADCFSLSAGVLRGGCRGLTCALASRQPDHHTTCQPVSCVLCITLCLCTCWLGLAVPMQTGELCIPGFLVHVSCDVTTGGHKCKISSVTRVVSAELAAAPASAALLHFWPGAPQATQGQLTPASTFASSDHCGLQRQRLQELPQYPSCWEGRVPCKARCTCTALACPEQSQASCPPFGRLPCVHRHPMSQLRFYTLGFEARIPPITHAQSLWDACLVARKLQARLGHRLYVHAAEGPGWHSACLHSR